MYSGRRIFAQDFRLSKAHSLVHKILSMKSPFDLIKRPRRLGVRVPADQSPIRQSAILRQGRFRWPVHGLHLRKSENNGRRERSGRGNRTSDGVHLAPYGRIIEDRRCPNECLVKVLRWQMGGAGGSGKRGVCTNNQKEKTNPRKRGHVPQSSLHVDGDVEHEAFSFRPPGADGEIA